MIRKTFWLSGFLIFALGVPSADASEMNGAVNISVAPDPVRLVRGDCVQALNFDFIVSNDGPVPLEVATLRMIAFDDGGAVLTRLEINRLGMCPSIDTLPNTRVEAGKRIVMFNPFHQFPASMTPKRLRVMFVFAAPEGNEDVRAEVEVRPIISETKTRLELPLKGKVFVSDGFEFYSHHRRVDLLNPIVLQLGIKNNPTRYGLDFMVIDETGSTFEENGENLEDYYIFGRPVLAPAAGVVVDCVDGRPDSPIGKFLVDYDEIFKTKNLRLFGGNFIYIDHGNGEFSSFFHLRPGSLKVRVGDRVTAGQPIAEVGSSGDSTEPHLHYQLNSRPVFDCDGIPAVFENFRRHLGSRIVCVERGPVDTGDIVERF
jgi:hypothetical protein